MTQEMDLNTNWGTEACQIETKAAEQSEQCSHIWHNKMSKAILLYIHTALLLARQPWLSLEQNNYIYELCCRSACIMYFIVVMWPVSQFMCLDDHNVDDNDYNVNT